VSKKFGEWYQKTNKTEDTNKLTLFVSSVLFVFWYHSLNVLDTLHICNISWLRVKLIMMTIVTLIGGFDEQWALEIQEGKMAKVLKMLD
jgi:hypothetical protein